jgi:hypothetical protein
MSFTPTKEAIEAAARKAQDAYNLGRQVWTRRTPASALKSPNCALRSKG